MSILRRLIQAIVPHNPEPEVAVTPRVQETIEKSAAQSTNLEKAVTRLKRELGNGFTENVGREMVKGGKRKRSRSA